MLSIFQLILVLKMDYNQSYLKLYSIIYYVIMLKNLEINSVTNVYHSILLHIIILIA